MNTEEMARILGFEELDSRGQVLVSDFAQTIRSETSQDREALRELFLEFEAEHLEWMPEMLGQFELRTLTVKDIMTTDVFCVPVAMKLTQLAGALLRRMITGVPVTAEDGTLKGVVSQTDLVTTLALPDFRRRVESLTAGDVMTKFPLKVRPSDSVEDVLRLMTSFRLHRILVTDEANRIAGIITTLDMARLLYQLRRHQV
ncbi:MAG: HPP family protein [Vulcanimicrobiota bacterium]